MSKESAIRFLRELGTNEKAQKLLQSKEAPKSKDDIIKAYAEVATELGEELSPEDVAIAVEEIETEIRQKTKAASSDIAELEDEDVENSVPARKGIGNRPPPVTPLRRALTAPFPAFGTRFNETMVYD